MRTCSLTYDVNAQDNKIHLTNNCFQQKTEEYGMHEPGNTLPLDVLFEFIAEKFPNCNIQDVRK